VHRDNNQQADQKKALSQTRGTLMNIGLRSILLIAAVVLFVVAIFVDASRLNWLAAGLAVFAGAFLVGELGPGFGGRLRRRL
jgi:hypothetical protein